MTHKNTKTRTIQFVNKTWEQIKIAYTMLKMRYRYVVMPIMAKLQSKGGLYCGIFTVSMR